MLTKGTLSTKLKIHSNQQLTFAHFVITSCFTHADRIKRKTKPKDMSETPRLGQYPKPLMVHQP